MTYHIAYPQIKNKIFKISHLGIVKRIRNRYSLDKNKSEIHQGGSPFFAKRDVKLAIKGFQIKRRW